MPTRNRNRVRHTTTGGYGDLTGYAPHWVESFPITSDRETCSDTTGPYPYTDHPLTLQRRWSNPLIINGTCSYDYAPLGRTVTFSNYMPPNRAGYQYTPDPTVLSFAYYKTKALANMDPYRPSVDLPLFLFELKDMPGMLRDLGNVLTGRLARDAVPGGYLAYQFGWAPLVSDVRKMFDFTRASWERCRQLRKMEAGHRIRRHLERGNEIRNTTVKDGYTILNVGPVGSNPWGVKADIKTVETVDVWFTANAQLTMPLPNDNRELRALSNRIVRGLTFRPATVWNAIPWTWLADYFLNIGDYVEANQGLTRFRCTRMNVMIKQQVDSSLENVRLKSGLTATTSLLRTVQKSRAVYANPTPSIAPTPFLSGKQTSILGALATASALRGHRR